MGTTTTTTIITTTIMVTRATMGIADDLEAERPELPMTPVRR
jgi:hypothetical protein